MILKQLHFRYEMQLDLTCDVKEHHFLIRCIPMESERQHCGNLSFRMDPVTTIDRVEDGFGNSGFLTMIREPHSHVTVTAEGLVKVNGCGVHEALHPMYCFPSPRTMPEANIREFLSRAQSEYGRAFRTIEGCKYLMKCLNREFVYEPGVTDTKTTASQALAGGRGVCQDYAHILISLLRLAGIPARYAAGLMLGEGASHAWVEVWMNGVWTGLDPTNNRLTDETYIKLTHGRDFEDGTLDRGTFLGLAGQRQTIYVKVEERT